MNLYAKITLTMVPSFVLLFSKRSHRQQYIYLMEEYHIQYMVLCFVFRMNAIKIEVVF
jgi:hypothetical protein